jgi:hypothetical protein
MTASQDTNQSVLWYLKAREQAVPVAEGPHAVTDL